MHAIVEVNGKQYSLQEGRYVEVDSLENQPEEKLEFVNVLMIVDGENTIVGTPYVEGATIQAKVLSHGKNAKVIVYKMRRKKGYRRKNGHRQGFTRLQIEAINLPGRKEKKAAKPKAEPAEAPAGEPQE